MYILAFAGGGWLVLLGVGVYVWKRSRDTTFRRRLQCTVGPATGQGVEDPEVKEVIFRPVGGQKWLTWLWNHIDARYPLANARLMLPRAIGVGLVAGIGFWFSMWFLKIPSGWWTTPTVGVASLAATWWVLSWFQARQAIEFIRQFPEVVDQIVRLAGAGVPALQAIAVAAQDARPPVEPILRNVRDGLVAGLDPDTVLLTASQRVRVAEFSLFVAVIRLQRRSGGEVSTAFSNLATTLRERRDSALKARASTAQTRLTLLVLTLMPALVLLAQKFIAPQSVAVLFGTEQGTTLLRLGSGLIIAGLLVARIIATSAGK